MWFPCWQVSGDTLILMVSVVSIVSVGFDLGLTWLTNAESQNPTSKVGQILTVASYIVKIKR